MRSYIIIGLCSLAGPIFWNIEVFWDQPGPYRGEILDFLFLLFPSVILAFSIVDISIYQIILIILMNMVVFLSFALVGNFLTRKFHIDRRYRFVSICAIPLIASSIQISEFIELKYQISVLLALIYYAVVALYAGFNQKFN